MKANMSKSVVNLLSMIGMTLVFATGCNIHRLDIQQGNILTDEMVEKVHTGMTEKEVQFVLGTPLIISPFDPGRWEYVYSLNKRGTLNERHLSLVFKDKKLVKMSGDVLKPTAFEN